MQLLYLGDLLMFIYVAMALNSKNNPLGISVCTVLIINGKALT